MTPLTGRVGILNAGDETIIDQVPMRHAIRMLHRGVAYVDQSHPGEVVGPFLSPKTIRLVNRVELAVYRWTGTVPYSKSALLVRDRGTCGYCGRPGETMDHIVPKSRGGPAAWTNATIACLECNQRKADRTPEEAGMHLQRMPYAPTYLDIFDPL